MRRLLLLIASILIGCAPAAPSETPDGGTDSAMPGLPDAAVDSGRMPATDAGGPDAATDAGVDERRPISLHADNPLWLDDGTGRALVLVGVNHGWEMADNGWVEEYTLDWSGWLDYLVAQNLNFVRLWRVESPQQTEADPTLATPMPYVRTGPGRGADGALRFDLTHFDPAYFERMRSRVISAGERGIVVDVMLFERHSTWRPADAVFPSAAHPFAAANNVNDIDADQDGDGQVREYFWLPADGGDPEVLGLQEAYVRRVIETLNDLDNVIFEVCNECTPDANAWQLHMLDVARAHMATLPQQHLVGFTGPGRPDDGGWPDFEVQLDSPADFVSPRDAAAYRNNPPANDGRKVIFADSDHIDPFGRDDDWVWRSFLRGLHPQALERFPGTPDNPPRTSDERDRLVRQALGWVNRFSRLVDLASMRPRNALSSTRYVLASPGEDYLVYAPDGGQVTLDLSAASGSQDVTYLNVRANTTSEATVMGGASRRLTPTFSGPAVIWVRPGDGDPPPPSSACADVPGGVAFEADMFVPTEAEPSRSFSIPTVAGRDYASIEVELDVTHAGWYGPDPSGTHAIFQLTRGRWRSGLYGFMTAFGPSRNELKVISNIDLAAGEVVRLNRRPARLESGQTYHVRYVYDAAGGERRLTVTNGEEVLMDESDSRVAASVRTEGSLDLILATPLNPEGPEVPSYGWTYDNFCLRVLP